MKKLIIWIFCLLYIMTSTISTIHLIDFFELSNPHWLAVTLGIAFEIGSAASLGSLAALEKSNKYIVWGLFFVLTIFQIQGNMWYTYNNIHDYKSWVELFWLNASDPMTQKRVLSIVSGAILPIVALGFVKSLVDYMKPDAVKKPEIQTSPEVQFPAEYYKPRDLESQPSNVNAILNVPGMPNETIDVQTLRNRELASELVSDSKSTTETPNPKEIDKSDSSVKAVPLNPDSQVSRGMQIKR